MPLELNLPDSAGIRHASDDDRAGTDVDAPAPGGVHVPAATVSVVIPAYNEERCIGDTLAQIRAYADDYPAIREVIVVDDGSTDLTASIVQAARPTYETRSLSLELVRNPRNLGKGATVRKGLIAASGEIVLFTDADLSAPLTEVPRLIDPIVSGECDIAIGSRAVDRSLIAIKQGWFRRTAGKVFNLIVRSVTGLSIQDTQCGFKAFRADRILPVFQMQRVETFAFDVEMLYLAVRQGLRVREIPVRWSHVEHTKVHLVRDSLQMFMDVLRVRLNDWRGRYGAPPVPAAEDARS